MSAPTPEIHHPQQPDGIADDGGELPDAARAARRVRAWICQWGDGLINVAGQRPLYARDLAALVRTVQDELPAARAELARTTERGCDECSVEPGERHRYPRCPGASSDVSEARADHARMTDTAEGLSVALTRVTRERDSLARRCAVRYEETEKLRAEVAQWEATYGKGAHLPGALNPLKRARRERDAARAEVERLRPVVDAATTWVETRGGWMTDDPDGRATEWDLALIDAVDALDADGPAPDAPAEDARLRRLEQAARLWHTANTDPAIIGDRGRARVALMLRQAVEDLDAEPIDRAAAEDALMAALYDRRSDALDADAPVEPAPDGAQEEIDFVGFAAILCTRCSPHTLIGAADLERHNAELHPEGGGPDV